MDSKICDLHLAKGKVVRATVHLTMLDLLAAAGEENTLWNLDLCDECAIPILDTVASADDKIEIEIVI